jgi:hypothetical protein
MTDLDPRWEWVEERRLCDPEPTYVRELLDYVNELTRTHTHREHYSTKIGATTYGLDHVTAVPPLLHQLRYASPSGMGEERANLGFESRPAPPSKPWTR